MVLITCLCISLPSCPLSSQVAFFPTNRRLLQMHLAHPGSGEFPTCVTYVILKLKNDLPFISSFFVFFLLLPMPVTFFPLNHFISYSIFIFLSFSYFIALPQLVSVFFLLPDSLLTAINPPVTCQCFQAFVPQNH